MNTDQRAPELDVGGALTVGGEQLIDVADLKCHLRSPAGPVRAVDGVSWSLRPGESLGIVGESGSGKTVMIRAAMGLIGRQQADVNGSVTFRGEELVGAPNRRLRRLWGDEIAMVFQDSMTALNPVHKIGKQVVESVAGRSRLSRSDARALAVELLVSVGIPDAARRLDSFPHELSGGMRQRVVIAGALAGNPSLLLADEPTTALDVTVQAQILNLLEQIQSERNMGLVLVTHDLGVVAGRTHTTAVMYGGQIVEMAPTPRLFDAMLMPYTKALFDSMPTIDSSSRGRLQTIGGRPPSLVAPPRGCRFSPRCVVASRQCVEEAPPLRAVDNHLFRCWHPLQPVEDDARAVTVRTARTMASAAPGGHSHG